MLTNSQVIIIPILNIILSFIIAITYGDKRRIGLVKSLFIGIGFTFLVSFVICSFSKLKTEPPHPPLSKGTKELYRIVFSLIILYCCYSLFQIANDDSLSFHGFGGYSKDYILQKILRFSSAIIGSIALIAYINQSAVSDIHSKGEEK